MIFLPLTPLVLALLVALAAINALATWERHKSFREMQRAQERARVALVRMSERVEQVEQVERDPRERETRDGIERVRLAAENAQLREALDQLARDGIGRERARTIELWPEREARQTVAVAVNKMGGAVDTVPAGPVPTWYRPTGRFSVSWGVA